MFLRDFVIKLFIENPFSYKCGIFLIKERENTVHGEALIFYLVPLFLRLKLFPNFELFESRFLYKFVRI